ncbi:hypothetical protein TNIN_172071 [Trichonephila inaurata madagascariensis]|uniref:DUF5641 domain-containing protein n=1 Tax=Trichonephila inaurata madagascariensis TaxID=2747483 RepID=A0A8X6MBB3_9ARAC|nr:hypothetical protein TNIN_172071 [Trichonephila inaurata madagascariensis]
MPSHGRSPDSDYRDTAKPTHKKGSVSQIQRQLNDLERWNSEERVLKVIRLIPEKDGKIRTVELKTRTGTMLRPIQRVYPLGNFSHCKKPPMIL